MSAAISSIPLSFQTNTNGVTTNFTFSLRRLCIAGTISNNGNTTALAGPLPALAWKQIEGLAMKRGMKVRKTEAELQILNRGFHEKSLMPTSFYKQLMQAGFAYRNCILVDFFPDGETSWCGVIIRQDGLVFEVNLDLHYPEYSEWTDISEAFQNKALRFRDIKPWLKEVVALEQFEAKQT